MLIGTAKVCRLVHNIREVLPQKQVLRQVLNWARGNRFRQSQGVGLDPRLQQL